MDQPRVLIGSCSWKYPSWKGIVYADDAEKNYLADYARSFRTVEIDQWFWSLFGPDREGKAKLGMPDLNTAAEYAASVDGRFRFTIKVANSITLTHFYRKGTKGEPVANPHFLSRELLDQFLSRIEVLREQTLALMFQFEYLNKQKMASVAAFLDRFAPFAEGLPDAWPFALEIRNPNYLGDAYFEFLDRYGLSPVFCEGYYMPPVTGVYRQFRNLVTRSAVVRLMGPDREGIEKETGNRWDSIVSPKDDQLAGIAEMVRDMVDRGLQVIVNVNNHYEGSAPLTIGKLAGLLGQELTGLPSKAG
ncbi:DUF72 domain-containing protein [Salinispira pacifica]